MSWHVVITKGTANQSWSNTWRETYGLAASTDLSLRAQEGQVEGDRGRWLQVCQTEVTSSSGQLTLAAKPNVAQLNVTLHIDCKDVLRRKHMEEVGIVSLFVDL